MAGLSKITVNVGQGGLGRRAPNVDKRSGIIFYNDSPPSGWSPDNIQLVFTLEEAEQKGLLSTLVGSEDEHYHVSEYFRIQPEGELYIGYFPVPVGSYDYSEIETMQNFAQGEIRQIAVYAPGVTFADAEVTKIQGVIETSVDSEGGYLSALYAADISATADLSTLTDQRSLDARKVSTVIAQDGGAAGAALFASKGYSITAIGAALGAVSKASVQQSIGYVRSFNISDGVELEVLAFANGDLLSAISTSLQGAIKDKGYLIARKYTPQLSGSYFERCPTATPATDDFAWLELNRTIDKAIRVVETALTPELQKDLQVNADGTLSEDVIGFFQDLASTPLEQMQADGEISDFQVNIDPNQDVLATSTLTVSISVLPIGVAEFITVNIGLVTQL